MGEGGERVENAVAHLVDNQAGIGDTVIKALATRIKSTEQHQFVQVLQGSLVSRLELEAAAGKTSNLDAPKISEERKQHLQKIFSNRLRYHDMEDRESRIAEPYRKTFSWIFSHAASPSNRWSNFKDWLESDSRLYWITGKAGSGKSTLMKFICQKDTDQSDSRSPQMTLTQPQRRCEKYLLKWAASFELIVATFYFWNSGVPLQMSQRGLLRSLLFQILQQLPDMIAIASPMKWRLLSLFDQDLQEWTESELQEMLHKVIGEVCKTKRICLFIDGLDEFEGEQGDLMNLMLDIVANTNTKVCVASRPWVEFEDAFGQEPSLRMQDLTCSDINHFVTENLQNDPKYDQLRRRESAFANQLIENIVNKSSGVFLWVNIVVKSLLAGMSNGDRIVDLQKRLDQLPPDLERLYDKILGSLDPFYLEHAAQLFRIVQESSHPLPLIVLYFADEMDLSSAIGQPCKSISDDEEAERLDDMQRRLNSRCKGLLEVSPESKKTSELTVQYLHRTVKDYVSGEKARQTLQVPATSPFNPHQSLCVGYLVRLKMIDREQHFASKEKVSDLINRCVYSCANLQGTDAASTVAILDAVHEVSNAVVAQRQDDFSLKEGLPSYSQEDTVQHYNWSSSKRKIDLSLRRKLRRSLIYNLAESDKDFMFLAVYHGVVEYVRIRVAAATAIASHLLSYAVALYWVRGKPVQFLPMIECLLSKGADPNSPGDVDVICEELANENGLNTIWFMLLWMIKANGYKPVPPQWLPVVVMMVQHGAKGEQQYLTHDDPIVLTACDEPGPYRITFLSRAPQRYHRVGALFRKDTMRLSEALKQAGTKQMSFLGRQNADDWAQSIQNLSLYNELQCIRQQYGCGKSSRLSSRGKRT